MTSRRHLGAVAGAATLLSAAPLSAIFDQWTWLIQCVIAVALIAGAATLARSLRAPVWAQAAAMLGALTLALTWMFPSHEEIIGIIPTSGTFTYFGDLMRQSVTDMRELGVPVPDGDPLLFITVLGVGVVAVCVDVFTVGLRRPALAGLPMLAIYSVPVAVYSDSVPVLSFMVGAVGFLWLLVSDNVDRVRRFGRRFTGDGRDVDVWEPSPLAAAGRRLAVIGVLLAVALPVAVPGMTTGLLERFGTGGTGEGSGNGRPGSRGSVDLFAELSGQLNQDSEEDLVKVSTNDPDPFYLRFGVADEINANGFRTRRPRGRPATASLPDQVAQVDGVTQHKYHASIEVTGLNMDLLPVYTQPVKLSGVDANWYYDQGMQVVYSNRSMTKGRKYSFDYVRSDYSPDALRSADPLDPGNLIQRQYTQVLPVRDIQERVAGLTRNATTGYDKVLAIFNYFSRENGFSYSLETKPGTSGSAIVDFLTTKTGFCEQYAAAMAWLVRSAGIPARVAFGFTRGSQTDGNAATLTNKNLHAWTEVYFNGYGWVPFDATPSASVPGAVDPDWAQNPDAPAQTGPAVPLPQQSTGPGGSAPDPKDPDAKDPDAQTPGGSTTIEPNAANWPWWSLSGAALILAVLAVPALRRQLLRRRRQAAPAGPSGDLAVTSAPGGPDPRQIVVTGDGAAAARTRAHAAWDELLDTMVDFRLAVDATETPRMTAERLVRVERLEPAAADGVRLLGRAEERARYAKDPLRSDQLVAALRGVRQAFTRRASRRTRIMAALMPPSVLQRWRLVMVDKSSSVVTALAGWRDHLVNRLSPRRLLPRRSS